MVGESQALISSAAALAFSYPIGIGLAAMGCGLGIGLTFYAGLTTMGRQPELMGKILIYTILGTAFIEALTIYALISKFLIS